MGHSIEVGVFWFTTMERSYIPPLKAGKELIKIKTKIARMTRDFEVGFPLAGILCSTLISRYIYEQPDFVDIKT